MSPKNNRLAPVRLAALVFIAVLALADVLAAGFAAVPEGASSLEPTESRASAITGAALRGHIFFLASDSLGGRHTGSRGFEIAATYAESKFRGAGLKPVIPIDGTMTYRQTVPITRRVPIGEPSMVVSADGRNHTFVHGADFKWLLGDLRACEDRTLEVAFVGYGISEPDFGWDDLRGLDLAGKVIVFVAGAPVRDGRPVLPEAVHQRYAETRSVMKKIYPMIARRAAAVFMIADDQLVQAWDDLPTAVGKPYFSYNNGAPDAFHIGCLCLIKPDLAAALLGGRAASAGVGQTAPEAAGGFELPGVSLAISSVFTEEDVPAWNVVGVVEGTDPVLRNEYIAVTAHLDTSAPDGGEIMNGADDNASGCAGLLEIAKVVAARPLKRSVVFILLAAEEGGVTGSRHFVSCCPLPLGRIRADVNLDGIGRSDPEEVDRAHFVLDSGSIRPEFTRLIKEVNAHTVNWPLKYEYRMGDSDHLIFQAVGIPAANFYSGHHDDVNRPTDDPEKIDFEKAQQIARLAYEVTADLASKDVLWQ
jgi:hypothetical protein